jgi:hypothetical protein
VFKKHPQPKSLVTEQAAQSQKILGKNLWALYMAFLFISLPE